MRILAAACALLLLAACGPRSVVSTMFPERRTVASTVAFDDAGRRVTQTIRYRCKIMDWRDSVAANVGRETRGDVHWLHRADGGLLVLGRLDECNVHGRKPGFVRETRDPPGFKPRRELPV